MAPKAYGRKLRTYRTSLLKIILNLLLAAGLILFAEWLFWVADRENLGGLWLPTFTITLLGIAYIARTLVFNLGRSITLYEKGVQVRRFLRVRRYFYDQINSVRVAAHENRRLHLYAVRAFEFYHDDTLLFHFDSAYLLWRRNGQKLLDFIADKIVAEDVHRILDGYEIIYDEFAPELRLGKPYVLHISLQGLLDQEKKGLPWARVQDCIRDPSDRGRIVVRDLNGEVYTRFRYYNTRNSPLAMKTIEAIARHAREREATR